MKEDYESQRYYELRDNLFNFQSNFLALQGEFDLFGRNFENFADKHNEIFEIANLTRSQLNFLKSKNLSEEGVNNTNRLITKFTDIIGNKTRLFLLYSLSSEIALMDGNFSDGACCFSNLSIQDINFSKIVREETNYSNFLEIEEPKPVCCYGGECKSCCDNCSGENYPVILLHGHNVYKKASAERSLDSFQSFQENLEEEGFINGGIMFVNVVDDEKGVLNGFDSPATFRASYYFDLYNEGDSYTVIQTKEDNIDTYAIRLKEIINAVKLKTGKDKVVVVSHSMGGLVTRRYVQIFGNENVEKIILLGTPNNGIDGGILNYCKILGAKKECSDMDPQSLLISKLRNEDPEVPVYNLIGLGCDMGGEPGDGIVKNESAFLGFAENFYFEGMCPSSTDTFHEHLLSVEKYPEIFQKVSEILKE